MATKLAKAKNAITIEQDGGTVGRLDISGEVGWDWYGDAWDAGYFKAQMDNLGPVNLLEVHINSPGGSVVDGIAIFNYLVQHPAPVHVYVDGVAASIASVIAMAGDKIFMPANTLMFVHEPWVYTAGNADQLRSDAEGLDRMSEAITNSYARHLKGSSESIEALMKAETWLTAAETAELFNNVVVMAQEATIKAALDFNNLGDDIKMPKQAKAFLYDGEEENEPVAKESILPDFIVKFLNKRGFDKAAKEVQQALADRENENNHQDKENDDMKPEEVRALAGEVVTAAEEGIVTKTASAVTQVLVEQGVIKDPKAKTEKPEAIAFEGDVTSPEDVAKHKAKLQAAKAQEIMESGDEEAIDAYLASISEEPKKKTATTMGSNLTTGKDDRKGDEKAADEKDTSTFLDSVMPKR